MLMEILNDLIGFHYNKVYVAINSGSDFGDTETWINGWGADTWSLDHNIRRVVDVNGDALPDLIGLSANNVYFSKNRRLKPYIEEITEPLGIKYFVSYGSLPNSSAYSSSGTLEEYPNPEIASPTYLVEYFEVEQPGGENLRTSFQYESATINLYNAVPLGFRDRIDESKNTSVTVYSKDVESRTTGMVLLQEIYKNGGRYHNKTINELDYELNDGVYFPFFVITTSSWDLSGDFIRTSTTENTYTNQYDPDGFQ